MESNMLRRHLSNMKGRQQIKQNTNDFILREVKNKAQSKLKTLLRQFFINMLVRDKQKKKKKKIENLNKETK